MYNGDSSSRSPGSLRHQPNLARQTSRQFGMDPYALQGGGLYTAEDHVAQSYGMPRMATDRMNATFNSNYGAGYDVGAAAWNAFGHAQNNTIGALGGTGRMKSGARNGRNPQLPSVRPPPPLPEYMFISDDKLLGLDGRLDSPFTSLAKPRPRWPNVRSSRCAW